MDKGKPKVGDKVWSLAVGNAARNLTKPRLTEYTVFKVGRKYFTAGESEDHWRLAQYEISNWRQKTDYSPQSVLYPSKQAYTDERLCRDIAVDISRYFDRHNGGVASRFSLDSLQKIAVIIRKESQE
jgi:hypothetical protein